MSADVIPLADCAVRRCRRYRLFASIALANGAVEAADKWRRRAADALSLAYELQPRHLPWQPPTSDVYGSTPSEFEPESSA